MPMSNPDSASTRRVAAPSVAHAHAPDVLVVAARTDEVGHGQLDTAST